MGAKMSEEQEQAEETPEERRRRQMRESQQRRRAGLPKLRQPAKHGGHGGVKAHKRAGEPLCEECRAFEREQKAARSQPTGRPPGRPKKSD